MLPDVEVPEKLFEFFSLVDVVVVGKHGEGKALAETARADIEEELVGSFYLLNVGCLVNVVTIVLYDSLEVHHAIRYSLRVLLVCLNLLICHCHCSLIALFPKFFCKNNVFIWNKQETYEIKAS